MRSVLLGVSCPSPVRRLAISGGGGRPVPFPPNPVPGRVRPRRRACASGAVRRRGSWGEGLCRPPSGAWLGSRRSGGSRYLCPSLCLSWAGTKAGAIGVAQSMEGVVSILFWFLSAC